MVLYRKYRPQTLTDLIGQELVKKALLSAFASGKLSHAYLFCGPRGTGKTSTARILAKMVNCANPKEGEPCNTCVSCLSITDGSNLDLVEIDAASNRGIDDIRSLKETIKLAPTAAQKKVYILDEIHMLSTEAFNALLKTLEEPPTHALFILATTEVQKIPVTILSRVLRLDFKLATPVELLQALQKIIDQEKIIIDPEALKTLAKKAGGSFRDGVKLLDQLAASGEAITLSSVESSLGTTSLQAISKLLKCMSAKDGEGAIIELNKLLDQGVSAREINLSVLDLLHQLLLISQKLGERLVKPEISEEQYVGLDKLAGQFPGRQLLELLNSFQASYEQLRFTSIPALPLELAIIENCLEYLEAPVTRPAPVAQAAPKINEAVLVNSDDVKKIHDRWSYLLETIKQYNYSLEALLRSARIAECNDTHVIFEVPYSFHQRILEAPKSRDMLESVLSDILGRSVQVSTILGQKPVARDEVANVEVAEDDDTFRMVAEIFSADPPA